MIPEQVNDGGPAFPTQNSGDSRQTDDGTVYWQYPGLPGMSLRDWFAGMALQGIVAGKYHHALEHMTDEQRKNPGELCYGVAWNAFTLADAMIAEREK